MDENAFSKLESTTQIPGLEAMPHYGDRAVPDPVGV